MTARAKGVPAPQNNWVPSRPIETRTLDRCDIERVERALSMENELSPTSERDAEPSPGQGEDLRERRVVLSEHFLVELNRVPSSIRHRSDLAAVPPQARLAGCP